MPRPTARGPDRLLERSRAVDVLPVVCQGAANDARYASDAGRAPAWNLPPASFVASISAYNLPAAAFVASISAYNLPAASFVAYDRRYEAVAGR